MNEVSKKSENRQFYKKMLWIAGPVMLQQAINLSVNLTDNIMVGKLQEEAISGVALGNQFYFLFQIFCMGLGGGSAVMVGQLWGKKDKNGNPVACDEGGCASCGSSANCR